MNITNQNNAAVQAKDSTKVDTLLSKTDDQERTTDTAKTDAAVTAKTDTATIDTAKADAEETAAASDAKADTAKTEVKDCQADSDKSQAECDVHLEQDWGDAVKRMLKNPANKNASMDWKTAPNKEQLHRRVAARIDDLESALKELKVIGGNVERESAILIDLQLAHDVMSGGWEKVGEVEAAKLADWLDKTDVLVSKGAVTGAPSAAPSRDRNAPLPMEVAVTAPNITRDQPKVIRNNPTA